MRCSHPRIRCPAVSTRAAPVRAAFRLASGVLKIRRMLESQGHHEMAMFMIWDAQVVPFLKASPVFKRLKNAFSTSPRAARHLGTLVGFGDYAVNTNASGHITSFLRGLINRDNALAYDDAELWVAAENFWRGYLEPEIEFEVIMPCWGIELPMGVVDLGAGCSLAKLTRATERELRRSKVHSIDWVSDGPTTYLSWSTRSPKAFGDGEWGKAMKENANRTALAATALQTAIEGMYAFRGGCFERGRWVTVRKGPGDSQSYERGSAWGLRDPFRRPTYTISDTAEAQALTDFLHRVRERKPEHLRLTRVPLRRFFLANERDHVDDAFVDLLIAVEALVSADGETGEITYRVGQRMALLVGETYQERLQLVQVMKVAYNVRSTLVHGREIVKPVTIGSERKPLRQFLKDVQEIVRRAIHKTVLITSSPSADADPFDWNARIFAE